MESPPPRSSIGLLAACQALLLTNSAGLIAMSAVVGHGLASNKALASLGATTYVVGSALTTLPMSLWMARVGRRTGFMTGAAIAIFGTLLAAVAVYVGSFALFCIATGIVGVYNAVGLQYRFAAAEISPPAFRAKAIALVLAGGLVGGFLGPTTTRIGQDMLAAPFAGSFLLLAAWAVVALLVQSRLALPMPSAAERQGGGRPLGRILRQPVFVVAALSAALGYGVMNLLMVATPLAMSFCSLSYGDAALVISWHVVGMFAPGLITGDLIKRFGVLKVIAGGVILMAICVAVALNGDSFSHFLIALVLLGVGWNFMYTGGTALLTEAYAPAERARTQGVNDAIVFATMGVTSLASGALVSSAGWERMNIGVLPLLAIVLAAVAWLGWMRRPAAATVA